MGQALDSGDYICDNYTEAVDFFFKDIILSQLNEINNGNLNLFDIRIPYWLIKPTNKSLHNYFLSKGFNITYYPGTIRLNKGKIDYYIQFISTS